LLTEAGVSGTRGRVLLAEAAPSNTGFRSRGSGEVGVRAGFGEEGRRGGGSGGSTRFESLAISARHCSFSAVRVRIVSRLFRFNETNCSFLIEVNCCSGVLALLFFFDDLPLPGVLGMIY
jgi:hypothetical protein